MENTNLGDAAFLTATAATSRSAREKWVRTQEGAGRAEALTRFAALPLLGDPALAEIACLAAHACRGRAVSGSAPFGATFWFGGVRDVEGGERFGGSIDDFAAVLRERARVVAEKREGWVVEPTTNLDGVRRNDSTAAMHALFLDCDGRGEWWALDAALEDAGLARLFYQSGGFTPAAPKWRCVLPLAEPFDVRGERAQKWWKSAYASARVVFGALGALLGEGFDPATDAPCCPWFLTERRAASAPERAVLWRPGAALDLEALLAALPDAPEEDVRDPPPRPRISAGALPGGRLGEISTALAAATSDVPSGRHDLYLALSGALLDRGVDPDDVLAIVEDVSSRYPRPHPEHHADNLHGARTTVDKFLRGEVYTRVGTLAERWPEAARALDAVLPSPLREAARRLLERLSATSVEGAEDGDAPRPPRGVIATTLDVKSAVARVRARKIRMLKRRVEAGEAGEDEGERQLRHVVLLGRLARGEPLAPKCGEDPEIGVDRDRAIFIVARLLAHALSSTTPLEALRSATFRSLALTSDDGRGLEALQANLERAYLEAQADRVERAAREDAAMAEFFATFEVRDEDMR